VWKYATNTGPIILRAMRDIRPLKFFGLIGLLLFILALAAISPVIWHYLATKKTQPFQSLITVSGVLLTLSFVMGVLALLADMMARHRRITEELLYLARRRVYGPARVHAAKLVRGHTISGASAEHTALNGTGRGRPSRALVTTPVRRSVEDAIDFPDEPEPHEEEALAAVGRAPEGG
jgi:hypothetical protein